MHVYIYNIKVDGTALQMYISFFSLSLKSIDDRSDHKVYLLPMSFLCPPYVLRMSFVSLSQVLQMSFACPPHDRRTSQIVYSSHVKCVYDAIVRTRCGLL